MSLDSVFIRLRDFLKLKTQIKNIYLSVKLEGYVPPFVKTDKRRLMQVLLNLSYNAVKYTFKGGVTITGRMKPDENHIFAVDIADTGVGIEPHLLRGVFNMFGMIDKKVNSHETGIGVGLYLCKNILVALGGSIEVTSQPGKGTTCHIELPTPVYTSARNNIYPTISKLPSMHEMVTLFCLERHMN